MEDREVNSVLCGFQREEQRNKKLAAEREKKLVKNLGDIGGNIVMGGRKRSSEMDLYDHIEALMSEGDYDHTEHLSADEREEYFQHELGRFLDRD